MFMGFTIYHQATCFYVFHADSNISNKVYYRIKQLRRCNLFLFHANSNMIVY